MRAIVFTDYGAMPTLVDVPEPTCPSGGVVIGVAATGVCRSDWHGWRGHERVPLPHIPGHEFAGVVETVGPDVKNWHPGDRVTVPFVCGCGVCSYCLSGDAQVCPDQTQPGFTGPGSFAELVVIHAADTNLVAVPDALELTTVASLGCRFATAFRAVTAHGHLSAGQWLAVFGCGGVGLSAVMIGHALGARVIGVDPSPAARKRAQQLGADLVLAPEQDAEVAKTVKDATSGGAHVAIDALGSPSTAASSIRSLRRRGRHIQVGLLLGRDAQLPVPMDQVIAQELQIRGSHGMAARDYPAMLSLVAKGTLRPELLIGAMVGLEEAGTALMAMDAPPTYAGMTIIELG